jgi:hypothetical protein
MIFQPHKTKNIFLQFATFAARASAVYPAFSSPKTACFLSKLNLA